MTRYAPDSDVLAIILILSDNDPNNTLKQAILNIEEYETLLIVTLEPIMVNSDSFSTGWLFIGD